MTDFEKVISFENLYKAHRRARLSKRHKKEVVQFELNLSQNLYSLHYDLKYHKYEIGGYHSFTIYDPKQREIQAITYRDRVVQHSICDNYLMPLIEKKLIFDNCACRKNKGTLFAIKRLKYFMNMQYKNNKNNGYFIKIDIQKYFDSIDHCVLKNKLAAIVFDNDILNLLYNIIDSYNYDSNKGLPMGNQTSQCFALLYLDVIDKYIKHILKVRFYVRYMDDMILIVDNRFIAQKILNENIFPNKKSQIISVKNGVNFLGWHFFVNRKPRARHGCSVEVILMILEK